MATAWCRRCSSRLPGRTSGQTVNGEAQPAGDGDAAIARRELDVKAVRVDLDQIRERLQARRRGLERQVSVHLGGQAEGGQRHAAALCVTPLAGARETEVRGRARAGWKGAPRVLNCGRCRAIRPPAEAAPATWLRGSPGRRLARTGGSGHVSVSSVSKTNAAGPRALQSAWRARFGCMPAASWKRKRLRIAARSALGPTRETASTVLRTQ